MLRTRVVILGAGFGGLAACEALVFGPVDVTIVDRHNYNTFQPLLYQVATAGLNPGDIAYPVRDYVKRHPNVKFRQDVVSCVDLDEHFVHFDAGDPVGYEYLVIATGAATNFFGVKGADSNAKAIYTMEDAIAVRDKRAAALERAAAHGEDKGELAVVIVGGGPTGVEMAGTVAELTAMELDTTYRELDLSAAPTILVEQQDRLLGGFDERLGAYAKTVLEKRGVTVRCGIGVSEVAAGHVVLTSGDVVPCGLVVWAAGVGPTALVGALALESERGRITVRPDLRVVGHDEVFAVGDVAAASGGDGVLPQLAQPALQGGRHAGRQILRLLSGEDTEAFEYHDKGIMATIGRRAAVAQLSNGIRLTGTPAWLAWLGLHVVFLLGFRNRLAVLLNWSWRYLWWRRGPRVIAGG
jgi:NADH dehydrogenase